MEEEHDSKLIGGGKNNDDTLSRMVFLNRHNHWYIKTNDNLDINE